MTGTLPSSLKPASDKKTLAETRNRLGKSRLELHQAHCGICSHKLREEIDEAFVRWDCVRQIAKSYGLHRSALYRHAHVTGLLHQRDRNIRRALGHIIQHAGRVEVTADAIIRAVKIFAHINEHGGWVQPPTRVIHSSAPPSAAYRESSGTPSHLIEDRNP